MKFEQFSHKPLEEQFNNREAIEFPGGNVEVVDIDPETKKTEIPVLVAPGWTATAEVFKNNILTLAEAGRRTISISAPHGIETEEIENFPEAELRKVAAVTEILEEKNIEKKYKIDSTSEVTYFTRVYSSKQRFESALLKENINLEFEYWFYPEKFPKYITDLSRAKIQKKVLPNPILEQVKESVR